MANPQWQSLGCELEIVLDGVINDVCNQCVSLFNLVTYTLGFSNEAPGNFPGCTWLYEHPDPPSTYCYFDKFEANLEFRSASTGGDNTFYLALRAFIQPVSLAEEWARWELSVGPEKPDCSNWADLNLPLVFFDGISFRHDQCDFSAATAQVSSVIA